MLTVRKSADRGLVENDWLKSHHSFSFGQYRDPQHMGFGPLRVINEDVVAPGKGFPTHAHADMEIITYVLDGALAHKDSMGNGSTIRIGDVQYMSAGSGVQHSEFNASDTETVHLLQIWIIPRERGAQPRYDQKTFTANKKVGLLRLIASPDGRAGSLSIRQDADIFSAIVDGADRFDHPLRPHRNAWVQIARGSVTVNDTVLQAGDAIALSDESSVRISNGNKSEILLFDLPI